ncbi:MAG: glycogen synthase GlgA [Agathobacter sp.]|nr:glycogen synthase GlgA [Agathobacter sp.]
MKKILFAASEAMPYVKTGGLADVTGSLPRCFNRHKYDVRVILPKYACMDEAFLPQLQFVCRFYVNLNWRRQYVGIFTAEYKGVRYYFVDNEFYFAGDQLYHNIYEDVEKFAYFSKAVLACLPYIDFEPDVIHCHDWQTGLIPVYLRTAFGGDQFYARIRTVFSIHNLKFQGRWKLKEVMDITGLPAQIFNSRELEFYGEANYLKGGVVYADAVGTVSPSYAYEICTPEGGEGLNGLLSGKPNRIFGILNGIDYEEYNPVNDPYIEANYGAEDAVAEKKKNKEALQRELGLAVESDTFLIGMVSRLTDQKGLDLVMCVLEELLADKKVQLVILGEGEERYENMLRQAQTRHPEKFGLFVGYSDEMAHKIYASADAFLMPSLFEPCGLCQMIAMRYGTVPIVRETGGLQDTVQSYNEYENIGTGFSFRNYNAHEMLFVIRYAHDIFRNRRENWNGIIRRAMKQDFSWDASAKQYEVLYERL